MMITEYERMLGMGGPEEMMSDMPMPEPGVGGGDPGGVIAGPPMPGSDPMMGGMPPEDPSADPESAIGMLLMQLAQGWQQGEAEAGAMIQRNEDNKRFIVEALLGAIAQQQAPSPMEGFAEAGQGMASADPLMDPMSAPPVG